ncbi:MAG: TrpB-like pyridoxal phosphate-dependent enzyme [Acidobacteria bacterium]|nr:TrpB-like pyridoxal phosphate-dependent enzyme [Acidobacteriota bacterium]
MRENTKWILSDREIPDAWLNLAALVRNEYPLPVEGEAMRPLTVQGLSSRYSEECARIELLDGSYGTDLDISIPGEVMDQYRKYRTTPLFRARGLEKHLGYEGRIFYKREDFNPTGSHKPNTAIPQALYAKEQGLRGLVTDTGAGQWGAAMAWACRNYGLECTVFMTRNSFIAKPYRRYLMELAGALVHSSPSEMTAQGRTLLAENPDHQGSLGIGMGEALETVLHGDGFRLALGCMSYYAALHQTIVGLELVKQLAQAGVEPDVLVACVGGGTNLFGFMSAYLLRKLRGDPGPEMIAAESANVPSLTKGEYRYDYADAFKLTPKVKMYTLGHQFLPPKIHSGGLRYHGKSPILSLMVKKGLVRAIAIEQERAFEVGGLFYECEGVLPAPESAHAIAATIDAAKLAKAEGRKKDIVFCLSGTGYLDLRGYADMFGLKP